MSLFLWTGICLSLNVNMKEAKYLFFSPEVSFGEKYSFKKVLLLLLRVAMLANSTVIQHLVDSTVFQSGQSKDYAAFLFSAVMYL